MLNLRKSDMKSPRHNYRHTYVSHRFPRGNNFHSKPELLRNGKKKNKKNHHFIPYYIMYPQIFFYFCHQ